MNASQLYSIQMPILQAAWNALTSADGILVPGGFGSRGVEGMILAAKFARESQRPYLGICLGMQASLDCSYSPAAFLSQS